MALGSPAVEALIEHPLQIVGIVLARNEETFVRRAVNNAAAFCDRWILADHGSRDSTPGILRELAASIPSAGFHELRDPSESHRLIQPLAGTNTWVFGVDGDEIYDPSGLEKFRRRLLSGEFQSHWMILGNVLHCDRLDPGKNEASGFLAPPSRSITKLYNFSAIDSWEGDTPERLHGGRPVFRRGFHERDKRQLQTEFSWDASELRCLHACFVPRSGLDTAGTTRENIMETHRGGWMSRIRRLIRQAAGVPESSGWKRERYRRGPRVTIPTGPFFS